jgi:hypothetical protein
MLQFEQFVARHGEIAAQAIIENLERFEGVCSLRELSLEERWQHLMQQAAHSQVSA